MTTDDPTALIGLPMIWVADRLLQLGYLCLEALCTSSCFSRAALSMTADGQESLQVIGKRRREMQLIAALIRKRYRLCVQEQAFQTEIFRLLVGLVVAVAIITAIG